MPYKYSKKKALLSQLLEYLSLSILGPVNFLTTRKAASKPNSILIVEPFQMGDLISVTVLLTPLKKHYPTSDIYILTKVRNAEVLSADTRVKEVLVADFPWSDYGSKKGTWQRWWRLLKELWLLRKHHFDIGIDCRGDVRSQLILMILGCSRRIGYTNYLSSNINLRGLLLTDKLHQAPYVHRYDWNIYILTLLGIPEQQLFPIHFPTLELSNVIKSYSAADERTILVHIGGGWTYKRWSNLSWAQLINWLASRYKNKVAVVAGPAEKELLSDIKRLLTEPDEVVLKVTSFEELITLTQQCQLFIGLDSGPMNIASALGKRIVALFGPGDSDVWYPYSPGSFYIHKKEFYSCNPCAQLKCFYPANSCMQAIPWQEVKELIEQAHLDLP